ncbi:MAG TPA: transposase [Candidatus Moranbacteria bacterium]|nr:transposase [Candidatus Moranbacteria bacterium]HAT75249.1 transposase [Candidatus Moranbacteria bacterium]
MENNQAKFRNKYRIKSTRLKKYDYSQDGAYFITVCTKDREHFFGEIIDEKLQETKQSKICMACWLDLPNHYSNCILDEFVIMPNHAHGIIVIQNHNNLSIAVKNISTDQTFAKKRSSIEIVLPVETGFKPVSISVDVRKTKRHSVSEIMRGFKTFTARKINDYSKTQGLPFWQSRFYDRIIRNEDELNRIREYIFNNPANWEKDRNNMENMYM